MILQQSVQKIPETMAKYLVPGIFPNIKKSYGLYAVSYTHLDVYNRQVKINLASIKDESYVSELEKRVEKLESDAIFCEKSILCLSKLSDTVYNR